MWIRYRSDRYRLPGSRFPQARLRWLRSLSACCILLFERRFRCFSATPLRHVPSYRHRWRVLASVFRKSDQSGAVAFLHRSEHNNTRSWQLREMRWSYRETFAWIRRSVFCNTRSLLDSCRQHGNDDKAAKMLRCRFRRKMLFYQDIFDMFRRDKKARWYGSWNISPFVIP